jgi:hypothetical protein
MLAVYHKQLIDLTTPVPVKRGLLKIILYIFLVFSCECDPYTLRFHAHNILIDDPFLDQCIDVYTVGGDQGRKIIIHFKMYRDLVFLHD